VPRHVQLAPIFAAMASQGASVSAIAAAHGTSWEFTRAILTYSETGISPVHRDSRKGRKRNRKNRDSATPEPSTPKCVKYAELVARLRDVEEMPFAATQRYIESELGEKISVGTVKRAYDVACPERAKEAASIEKRMNRGNRPKLGGALHAQIRELLRSGEKSSDIAKKLGCSVQTVNRERRRI
jgi:hypothetical protein